MADRTIRVTVVGDSRGLQTALKGSEKSLQSLDRTAAKSQQGIAKLESGFSKFGSVAALTAGFTAVAAAFNQVTDAAARLQTAQAANQRIWGDQAAGMQEAAKAASDYGLAQSDYLQTAAKLGSQLRNLGADQETAATSAQSLMRMGENLAAVFGTDVPSAVGAISAALRGEFDPLEQYGIGITAAAVSARMAAEGISKAEATIAIAMEQSTATIGAAAAAQDTFAGKQRALTANFENAKAAVGQGFLPAASAAVDVLNGLAKAVQAVPEGLRSFIGTALAAGVAIKALQVALGLGAVKAAAFAVAMERSNSLTAVLASGGVARAGTAMQRLGNALPVVGIAALAVGEAFAFMDAKAREAAVSQEALTKAVTGTGDAAAITTVAQQLRDFGPALAEMNQRATGVVGAFQNLGSVFLNWGQTSGIRSMEESIGNLNSALQEFMAVNPAAGAAATRAAFNQLVASGVPAEQATQQLASSLAQADAITQRYGQTTVNAAAQTQALTAAFDAATARANALGDAFEAMFAGLDVDVALQRFREALAGIKEASKGGFDATEIQALSQAWRTVSTSMMQAGATTQQIITRYDSMRAAAARALGNIGIHGQRAGAILDKVFGKRYEVKAKIDANADPAVDEARRTDRLLNAIKQRSPAKILALWSGQRDADRADREIDGVRQNRPATIDANAQPAINAANAAANALGNAAGAYFATLNISVNEGPGVSAWLSRLFSAPASMDWSMGFDQEDVDVFGPQVRMATPAIEKLLGARLGGRRQLRIDVILSLSAEGPWEAVISQLDRLQKLASQTDSKGRRTALARAAQAELKTRRALLKQVQAYISNAKIMFQGSRVGYQQLKEQLDAARSSMAALADEMARALNGVNIASAWQSAQSRVQSRASDLQSETQRLSGNLDTLRSQMTDLQRSRAETWNPRLVEHYNARITQTQAEINRVNQELQRTQAEWQRVSRGPSTADLKAELQKQITQTRRFYNQINQLRGALSADALAELVRMGPEAGADVAAMLINDRALRRQYDSAFAEAGRYSRQLGTAVAEDVFRPQITAVTNAIAALRKGVEAWLRQRKTVQVRLNWTNWRLNPPRDLPDWVVNPRPQRVVARQEVNVTVQGMVADPEGTARAIRRLLRDSANRNGQVQWARS